MVKNHIPNCPVIFQEYVPKRLELRITVVGNKVFTCAIYSQESESLENRVDWRHDVYVSEHEAFQLPVEIEAKYIQLVKELGL